MGQGLAGVTARQEARPPNFFTPSLPWRGQITNASAYSIVTMFFLPKPMTFTPNNEPPHTAKMIKSITEGSHNFKEGIGVAFAQLQGMPPENREELFRESFAPGSYWGEILA